MKISENSNRNKNALIIVVIVATLAFASVGCASGIIPPEEEWNQTFGGSDRDEAEYVQQTSDGGYILVGITAPYDQDVLLVKTDENGNKQWDKIYVFVLCWLV